MTTRSRNARERAYEHVRRRILTMEYAPSQRLDENQVAEGVGVSRTPHSGGISSISGRRAGYYRCSRWLCGRGHEHQPSPRAN